MKFLLDTCVISDFVKGDLNTIAHFKLTSPSEIAISTITLMEIEYGLALNPARAKILKPIFEDLFSNIYILNFDKEDAKAVAPIRAELKQKGFSIGPYDILLAGVAVNRNMIFVSSNAKEFNRIDRLRLENWR